MFTTRSLVPSDEISEKITVYLNTLKDRLRSCAENRYHKPIAISSFCKGGLGNHIDEFFEMPFNGPPTRFITQDIHDKLIEKMKGLRSYKNNSIIVKPEALDDLDCMYVKYKQNMREWNSKINRQIFLPKANQEVSLIFVRSKIRSQWCGVGLKDPETFWKFLEKEVYEQRAKGDFVGAMRMSYSVLNILNNTPEQITSNGSMLNVYKALTIFTGDWAAYIAKNYTMERFYIQELHKVWREFPDIQIKNRILNTYGKHNPHGRFAFRVLETTDLQLSTSKIGFYYSGISASLFNVTCASLEQGADLDTPIRELLDMSPNEAFRLAWTLELAKGEFEDALFTMPKHAEWLGHFGRLADACKMLDQAKKIVAEHKHLHIGLRIFEVEVTLLVKTYKLSLSQRDYDLAVKAESDLVKEYDRRRTPLNLRKNSLWK